MSNKLTQCDSDGNSNSNIANKSLLDMERASRIAKSVALAGRIPDGDEYVCILGNGDESNNTEALTTLILRLSLKLTNMHANNQVEYVLDWLGANLGHLMMRSD